MFGIRLINGKENSESCQMVWWCHGKLQRTDSTTGKLAVVIRYLPELVETVICTT